MSVVTFRPARRESVSVLIGLAGASGSGKSFSALRLARGLAGDKPFAAVDTEAGRLLHYADRFQPWEHGELRAPFRPAAYAQAIAAADEAGYPVIVVDSASHEHAGEGGILDAHEHELQRMAGDDFKRREALTFAAWVKPKTEHKAFVNKLLQLRAHVILCFRAEERIEIVKQGGKTVVRPKKSLSGFEGWIPVCEKSLPFELTLSLLLTPDAPGVPKPIKLQDQHRPFVPLDQCITEETGRALAQWAGGTADTAEAVEAPALVTDLLAASELLGKRDQTSAAIAATRRLHAADPDQYVAWLRSQFERAQTAIEQAREAAGADLFSEAGSLPTASEG